MVRGLFCNVLLIFLGICNMACDGMYNKGGGTPYITEFRPSHDGAVGRAKLPMYQKS